VINFIASGLVCFPNRLLLKKMDKQKYLYLTLYLVLILLHSCANQNTYKNYCLQKQYIKNASIYYENDSFTLAEPYYINAAKKARPDVDFTLSALTVFMNTNNRKQFNNALKNMPKHAIKCYNTDSIRYGTFMSCILERFIFNDSLLMEYIKKDYYSAKILTHLTSQEKIIASKKKMRLLSELIKLNETDIKLRENLKLSYELDSINNFQFYSIIKSGWPNRNKFGEHTQFLLIHMPDTFFYSPYHIPKKAYKAAKNNNLNWSVYEHLMRRGPVISDLVFNKKSLDVHYLSKHLKLKDEELTLYFLIIYCLNEFYDIPLNKIHLSVEYKDNKNFIRYQNMIHGIEQYVSDNPANKLNLSFKSSKVNRIVVKLDNWL